MLSTETGTRFIHIELRLVAWDAGGGRQHCVALLYKVPLAVWERFPAWVDVLVCFLSSALMEISELLISDNSETPPFLSTPSS